MAGREPTPSFPQDPVTSRMAFEFGGIVPVRGDECGNTCGNTIPDR
jgi:hypothetical protein